LQLSQNCPINLRAVIFSLPNLKPNKLCLNLTDCQV
jgi:hypothetical protein